jgi:cell division protease FtsH
MIDEEVRKLISDCYDDTKEILKANTETLEKIVKVLLEKETIDAEEFKSFIK